MKVLVTGGTGFVGARIAADLVRDGHDVRLLVRRPEQVPVSLAPYDVPVGDVVAGDVLDPVAVDAALDGCEAVVHAAAVFSLKANRSRVIRETNAQAAEIVLCRAVDRGLDPVVHISSTVALTRHGGSGPDLPLGDVEWPYAQSKVASEIVARRLQEAGAPVVTVYPGSVYGPHDPYRGEQSERLRWILLGRFPFYPPGCIHTVDVRTVSATVVRALEPGRGPRRYVVPGDPVDADLLYGTASEVTGRRLPHLTLPPWMLLPFARSMSWLQQPLPDHWYFPADPEGVAVILRSTVFDDEPARADLGVEPVPFDRSVRDTVVWLVEAGRLPARYAGKALTGQA
ncbi:MAG TPA: NAD-dependent epimerase/dehydratase family protein [Nocardioidaceae bacterium]|nr:NAD-dependent epimerase/dehydratase family protein [Nocardioidaceae bacterium]